MQIFKERSSIKVTYIISSLDMKIKFDLFNGYIYFFVH